MEKNIIGLLFLFVVFGGYWAILNFQSTVSDKTLSNTNKLVVKIGVITQLSGNMAMVLCMI